MSNVTNVTLQDFDSETMNTPVILDFYSESCDPCVRMEPVFEELANEYSGFKFLKIDVIKNSSIADKFRIRSIPTFIFMNENKVIDSITGLISKDTFEKRIKRVTKSLSK